MKYDFNGFLINNKKNQIPASIHLEQKNNGSIYAQCSLTENSLNIFDSQIKEIKGTSNSYNIQVNPTIIREINLDSSGKYECKIMCSKIVLHKDIPENTNIKFRFRITNLKFIGNEYYLENANTKNTQLNLSINGFNIIIRRVIGYDGIIKELEYTSDVDITAEMIIDAIIESKDKVLEIVNNICSLLSLARSTKINWISYTLENSKGESLEINHENKITKSYSSLKLIGYEKPDELKYFIESTYVNFINKNYVWMFDIIIEEYIDAIKEGDYLEFRGLKLATTMEFILGNFHSNNSTEYILPEKEFNCKNGIESSIKKAINCKLSGSIEKEKIDLLLKSIKALNSPTFRDSLIKLYGNFKFLLLKEEKEEINNFNKLRNNLVHSSSFQPFKETNSWNNFRFMLVFVGKIILMLLGYNGNYLDWSSADISNEKSMLKKMKNQCQKEE